MNGKAVPMSRRAVQQHFTPYVKPAELAALGYFYLTGFATRRSNLRPDDRDAVFAIRLDGPPEGERADRVLTLPLSPARDAIGAAFREIRAAHGPDALVGPFKLSSRPSGKDNREWVFLAIDADGAEEPLTYDAGSEVDAG